MFTVHIPPRAVTSLFLQHPQTRQCQDVTPENMHYTQADSVQQGRVQQNSVSAQSLCLPLLDSGQTTGSATVAGGEFLLLCWNCFPCYTYPEAKAMHNFKLQSRALFLSKSLSQYSRQREQSFEPLDSMSLGFDHFWQYAWLPRLGFVLFCFVLFFCFSHGRAFELYITSSRSGPG